MSLMDSVSSLDHKANISAGSLDEPLPRDYGLSVDYVCYIISTGLMRLVV